jgi:hypothetical protein
VEKVKNACETLGKGREHSADIGLYERMMFENQGVKVDT